MRLPTTFPRFARTLLLLTVALGITPVRATAVPPDPLVGDWLYYKDVPTTFNADGTTHRQTGEHGVWEYQHNPEAQRHYRIVWGQGNFIDDLSLAEDGQHAHVRNEKGAHQLQYDMRRPASYKPAVVPTPAPSAAPATPAAAVVSPTTAEVADPIVGEWQWPKGNSVTFAADGTMASAAGLQGVWMFLRNPEGRRKYVLDWKFGLYTDHMTYNRDARTGHLVNQKGDAFDVVQGAATSGKPAGYFGAPGN